MKKVISFVLAIVCITCCVSFFGCSDSEAETAQQFYDAVVASQILLDDLADDIYSNWYDCIYDDAFGESIDLAIASAVADHSDDIDTLEENESTISSLFQQLKEAECASQVKAVMAAYSDYYEFVVNVSGSFKSFSADKETLKKELASALRDLSFEL